MPTNTCIAAFNEKLLLGNGLIVYPFKNQPGETTPQPRSLRQAVSSINNDRDLNEFVVAQHSKVLPTSEVKYEKNPLLAPAAAASTTHSQPFVPPAAQPTPSSFSPMSPGAVGSISSPVGLQSQSMGARTSTGGLTAPGAAGGPGSPQSATGPQSPAGGPTPSMGGHMPTGGLPDQPRPFGQQEQRNRSFSQGNPMNQGGPAGPPPQFGGRGGPPPGQGPPRYGNGNGNGNGAPGQHGAPQLGNLPFHGKPPGQRGSPQQNQAPFGPPGQRGSPGQGQAPFRPPGDYKSPAGPGAPVGAGGPRLPMPSPQSGQPQGQPPAYASHSSGVMANAPPPKPVFGVSLSKLYERDGLAVPMVVYQCIQAVDMYGLGVEGIYRQSGSMNHIQKLKSMFDADSQNPALDFRNPESFYHDVNSVTGLLKQFFRDLPDPILTMEHYNSLIHAAKHDDDVVRRDSLHAIINSLPDPNYATLRAITLHLYRVMDNSHINRMNSHNLAVIFGPTLMGSDPSTAITDAGWQIKVVDTILQNTYQIFDED